MVRAKFRVTSVEQYVYPEGAAKVVLSAVYKSEPGVDGNAVTENHIFGKATPSGTITMQINNPDAAKQLGIGKYFYVDFTEAPE